MGVLCSSPVCHNHALNTVSYWIAIEHSCGTCNCHQCWPLWTAGPIQTRNSSAHIRFYSQQNLHLLHKRQCDKTPLLMSRPCDEITSIQLTNNPNRNVISDYVQYNNFVKIMTSYSENSVWMKAKICSFKWSTGSGMLHVLRHEITITIMQEVLNEFCIFRKHWNKNKW